MASPSEAQAVVETDDSSNGENPAPRTARTVPPRNPYEEAVVAIWSELLGRHDFGVHDDFFELGGHSLLAPRVVARIRKTLGVAIPVKDFFEAPTPAALAATVAAQSSAPPRVVTTRPVDAEPVLSFDQQRLWLENQLLPGAAYNIHGRRRLSGPLDVDVLAASIRVILLRHETLRTRFPTVDGKPTQVVDDLADDWRLPVTDLTGVADGAETARRLADEQATTPFDLAHGPLLRCLLIRLDATTHVLSVTMHHIISDAWSIGLFVRELLALYEAGGDVERAGLAPLPVQYRDYAVWQRGHLTGETLDREVAYWRRHLAGAPAALTMPSTSRQAVARQSGGRVHGGLSAQETAALRELCRRHGVSLFMALLAASATVLTRWSGQRDIVIGVPIAGRTDTGTDQLIGFFVNTLPIRVDLSDEPSFADLLARARQVSLDGYAHAEAPVDVLVERLELVRDPRRTPLFEVILNVIGDPESERVNDITIEPMDAPTLPSKFDLVFNAQESGDALGLHLDFNADRFDAAMMDALVAQVQTLLRAVLDDPGRRLLDYPLGPEASSATPQPVPATAPRQAAAAAQRIAVVDADGAYTYDWLDRAAAVIAARLPESGTVGVVRRPSAAFVAAVLACAGAGLPYSVIEADVELPLHVLGVSTVLDVADDSLDLGDPPPTAGGHRPDHGDWAVDRFGLTAEDRIAVLSPRPGMVVSAIWTALTAGAVLHLPPGPDVDPGSWLRDNAITAVYLIAPQLRALTGPLPALRYGFVENAGDLLSHDVRRLRGLSPDCRFIGLYRTDRAGRPLAVHDVPQQWRLETAPLRVPLGTELPGAAARLTHPGGQPAAVGEVAELCFGTYRTGDLARRWADGTLEFVAAAGVDPAADPIETVDALRDLPEVTDAVVTELVGPDGDVALAAHVAGVDEAQAATIRRGLVLRLPEYLIPRHVVVVDALPRTPHGDYDLVALPAPDELDDTAAYVAPRTPLERRLTEIFEELLEVERVGIHDTFFELNGFSLLATTLTARVRDEFNVELSLREVFGSPTVESLALLVLSRQSELSDADELEALLNEIGQSR